jgi:hypothetical protein
MPPAHVFTPHNHGPNIEHTQRRPAAVHHDFPIVDRLHGLPISPQIRHDPSRTLFTLAVLVERSQTRFLEDPVAQQ